MTGLLELRPQRGEFLVFVVIRDMTRVCCVTPKNAALLPSDRRFFLGGFDVRRSHATPCMFAVMKESRSDFLYLTLPPNLKYGTLTRLVQRHVVSVFQGRLRYSAACFVSK